MCLAAQKDGPGLAVALGCGLDAVGFEDLPHGGGRDLDPQGGQFAVDSPVVPAGIFLARRGTRAWMLRTVGGRPGRFGRDAFAWRRRSRSRCQRRTVSGDTIRRSWRSLGRDSRCSRAARNARSGRVRRGLSVWRCRMASWWRSVRISMSLSESLRGMRRMRVNTLVSAR